MTHNERRTSWYKEGFIGLGVGILFGVTNVCVGHPLDTIKTKMQAQAGYEKMGMIRAFQKTIKSDGFLGLYRGCIPPMFGSGIFRSVHFATFEAMYTFMDTQYGRVELPYSGGLQLRVIGGGIIASTARSIIECPLEYIKVRRQTGQSWSFSKLYTGYGVTWCRTTGLMTCYFILFDSGRRHLSSNFASNNTIQNQILVPFLSSGIAATIGWWLVWPLEVVKSQVQGNYGKTDSVLNRIRWIAKEKGFLSLYRGIAPGSLRSFFANGISMIVMTYAQRKVTAIGLRD